MYKRPSGASLTADPRIETSIKVTFSGVDDNVLQAKVSPRSDPSPRTASPHCRLLVYGGSFLGLWERRKWGAAPYLLVDFDCIFVCRS